MLTETQGEGYTIYLNGRRNQKSLGSSALDANRFAKINYRIYEKALWVPFDMRRRVVDKEGRWCPNGDNNITFSVEGEGY